MTITSWCQLPGPADTGTCQDPADRDAGVTCLARPLLGDGQVGELGRAVEDVCHHRPGGLQSFLAARILLACACFLLAVEYHQRVHLAGVLLVMHHQRPDQSRSWLLRGPDLVVHLRGVLVWLESHRDELCPHSAFLS